ncbi:MAG: OsmC family protein [Pararobbsia sp.]
MDPTQIIATLQGPNYRVLLDDGHHTWIGDEPTSAGGGDRGPTPFALLISSLGTCTAITVKMYAERKGWPLEHVDVRLSFETQADGSTIGREVVLYGELDDAQRERLLQIANACPVHKVLSKPIVIRTNLAAVV